ncbi:aldehyde dehydrogenase family protein [Conexibacter arvalis]|uniref:L-glutamate gamma-semialdehyde dehydrogenase n=1 Tax=Conexibacter arvalis TaxID=912552 RepID=A0A840ID88_9ACTN|nr:aldehyde dehydrogenase family protein [Conexibacter arvalis]MBB4662008.1 1-pyrroline-5-carboxylate dehydrogenase [Conexibacter arvalis]
MATRFTYTSGSFGTEVDGEFERQLLAARSAAPAPLPHVIAGREVAKGPVFARVDPANVEQVASRAHAAGPELVDAAVAAANAARAQWRRTPYAERCRRLRAIAEAIGARHLETAARVSLETGKNRAEAVAEVQEAIDLITTYCDHMEENAGYEAPLLSFVEGERNTETLRPYGSFGVICPFNFPFALTIGMSVAALVAGNTVVVKPSEDAPWTGALFAELALPHLPEGVLNLVHGGVETGRALADAAVDGIAFTGSAAVGREIVAKLQGGRWARPALTEMGGKNPAIVTASADVRKAAEGVARAGFGLSGQKCSACSRAIVLDAVYDEFVEQLAEVTASFAVGDPADAASSLGPVINERAYERFARAVADAEADGRIVAGGRRPDLPGFYVEPTVVADLPRGHRLTREELFLPFVTVTRVATLEEAIEEANAIDYGLTAGIFAEDQGEVDRFLDEIEAGVLYVNRGAGATTGAWPGTQSFCGWKSSGTTGKGGLGPWYVPQFMREQSRTVVA